jgi:ADP-heptose:LPS heptosyltransferase
LTILLVRLRLIGDVVLTTPIVRAIRGQYPAAHLIYLVEPAAAPVLADNPHLSEVIIAPHRRGWRRLIDDLRLARMLRRRRIDVAIDLHGGPRAAWLTWATRARMRVGYDVPGRSWMYTRVVPRPKAIRPRHAVENQWDLLTALDPGLAPRPDRERDRSEMPVSSSAVERAERTLRSLGVPAGACLAVLHVSAGNPFRRWPEAAFAELGAGLAAGAPGRWVLVTAGPSDREAAARVLSAARVRAGNAGARIVCGDTLDLPTFRAVLGRASLFIGGDSGPLHIASTSDVPIVGLYGPTLPVRSAPWRPAAVPSVAIEPDPLPCRPCDQRVCVPGDFRCLSSIRAARVLDAAQRLLEAHA